jgi:hypothetical protein
MPPAVVMPPAWITSMTSMVSLAKACAFTRRGLTAVPANPRAKVAGEHRGTGRGVEGSWAPQTDDHLWHPVKGECPN